MINRYRVPATLLVITLVLIGLNQSNLFCCKSALAQETRTKQSEVNASQQPLLLTGITAKIEFDRSDQGEQQIEELWQQFDENSELLRLLEWEETYASVYSYYYDCDISFSFCMLGIGVIDTDPINNKGTISKISVIDGYRNSYSVDRTSGRIDFDAWQAMQHGDAILKKFKIDERGNVIDAIGWHMSSP